MGLGRLVFLAEWAVSSSDDESESSTPVADGPLLAVLKYVRNGGVPLPAIDLADLKIFCKKKRRNL